MLHLDLRNPALIPTESEGKAGPHLEDTARTTIVGRGNLAGLGYSDIGVGSAELGVVEKVVGIGTDFETHTFADGEGLAYAHVEIYVLWPVQEVPSGIAKCGSGAAIGWVRKRTRVKPP